MGAKKRFLKILIVFKYVALESMHFSILALKLTMIQKFELIREYPNKFTQKNIEEKWRNF